MAQMRLTRIPSGTERPPQDLLLAFVDARRESNTLLLGSVSYWRVAGEVTPVACLWIKTAARAIVSWRGRSHWIDADGPEDAVDRVCRRDGDA